MSRVYGHVKFVYNKKPIEIKENFTSFTTLEKHRKNANIDYDQIKKVQ
jgi:hypothetical protein